MKKVLLVLVFLAASCYLLSATVWAESCTLPKDSDSAEVLQKKIDECKKLIDVVVSSTRPHEQKAKELESEIAAIDANIRSLEFQIALKKNKIAGQEVKLAEKQTMLETHIRDFYKKDYSSGLEYLLTTVFAGENLGDTVRGLGYRQSLIDQQKRVITSIVLEITDLAAEKKKLEETQTWVAAKKRILETTLAPIRDLVNRAKAYQSQLSQTVGSLTSRQQELIAARLGSLGLSRSAGISMACADDRNIDPGFSPRFAFYTFGIPHRVGMNQFGAKGRAQSGETNPENILRAYFQNVEFSGGFEGANVRVNGTNEYGQTFNNEDMNVENYVNHLYEMPASWPAAALQAQAIAARSYALAVMRDNGYVRPSQADQVIKREENAQTWRDAVVATRGKVMTQGGQPVKAWYSSTDGGYTLTSDEVWGSGRSWTKHTRDTSGDVNSISDLQNRAYDRESPCFYNAQGWRTQYNKSAWLKAEEVADIVNVILVSAYTNDWDSWDSERVKAELRNRGTQPFSRIDSVSMSFDLGWGRTTSVSVSGDGGSKTFDGKTFKDYFNVRAPANIAIVGPLFNIEKR